MNFFARFRRLIFERDLCLVTKRILLFNKRFISRGIIFLTLFWNNNHSLSVAKTSSLWPTWVFKILTDWKTGLHLAHNLTDVLLSNLIPAHATRSESNDASHAERILLRLSCQREQWAISWDVSQISWGGKYKQREKETTVVPLTLNTVRNNDSEEMSLDEKIFLLSVFGFVWVLYSSFRTKGEILTAGFIIFYQLYAI